MVGQRRARPHGSGKLQSARCCLCYIAVDAVDAVDAINAVDAVDIHAELGGIGKGEVIQVQSTSTSATVTVTASTNAIKGALQGRVYVAASAGNHGVPVAAGAKLFGARAVIYLAETVPGS
jgi:diaminopropionate ammonia-lyase